MNNSRKKGGILVCLIGLLIVGGVSAGSILPVRDSGKTDASEKAHSASVSRKLVNLDIPFIENRGQVDDSVKFYASTFGGSVFVTNEGEIIYSLLQSAGDAARKKTANPSITESESENAKPAARIVLTEELVGARVGEIKGEGQAETVVNYFKGDDPSAWKNDIPTYETASLGEVYSGVELKLKAHGNNVEKLFFVNPGASADSIRIKLTSDDKSGLSVNDRGELQIKTAEGAVLFTKPVAFQEIGGERKFVHAAYSVSGDSYGFTVGDYNRDAELVIDPAIVFSTFLGGDFEDEASGVGVDSSGNIYVTGYSNSSNFPVTSGVIDTSLGGSRDAFVAKINPSGDSLIFSTFIGGSNSDEARGIAIDPSLNIFIAGYTNSNNYPTTVGAYSSSNRGARDAFITKINPAGNAILYSTYFGGGSTEICYGMALGSDGRVYVTGYTQSTNFPITPGAYDAVYNGGTRDLFVSKINPAGGGAADLEYSTYIGGSTADEGRQVTVDAAGFIYIMGETEPATTKFPTTPGAIDNTIGDIGSDLSEMVIVKLNPAGGGASDLLYSTYIGGFSEDGFAKGAGGIAVDSSGHIYMTGQTGSPDLPVTAGSFNTNYGTGTFDSFVLKINPAGAGLNDVVYGGFLGGVGGHEDAGYGIFVDSIGRAYVTGFTESTNFPTTPGAADIALGGERDAFVTVVSPDGSSLEYSSYLGGAGIDTGFGIAADSANSIYVVGQTVSADFFATPGAVDTTYGGNGDAFIVKISLDATATPTPTPTATPTPSGSPTPTPTATPTPTPTPSLGTADLSITKTDSPDPVTSGSSLTYTITVTNNGPNTATGVTLADTLPADILFGSAKSTQGRCSRAGDIVTCAIGSMASGASVTITIVIKPQGFGMITNTAAVSSSESDPNTANNTASAATSVTVTCFNLTPTIVGTGGNNNITGTEGDDVIHGLAGDDTINGLGGNDIICGGDGNDIIDGGTENDRVFGDKGNDTINGSDGADILNGGAGNDTLNGGAGNDTLTGISGDDAMNGGTDTDTCNGGTHVAGDTAANCETVTNVP